MVKNPPANAGGTEDGVPSLGQKDPWRRKWPPTSILLPGKSHGTEEPDGLQSTGLRKSDLATNQNKNNGQNQLSVHQDSTFDSHSWFLEGTQVFQCNRVSGG